MLYLQWKRSCLVGFKIRFTKYSLKTGKQTEIYGFVRVLLLEKPPSVYYTFSGNKPGLDSPCCCGVSCWWRASLADRGWRLLMWWWAGQRWRWEPAAATPSAAQPPAAWGQRLETWEVSHLQGTCEQQCVKHLQREKRWTCPLEETVTKLKWITQ